MRVSQKELQTEANVNGMKESGNKFFLNLEKKRFFKNVSKRTRSIWKRNLHLNKNES